MASSLFDFMCVLQFVQEVDAPFRARSLGPAGPEAVKDRPEESVQRVPYWPRPFTFEHGDLVSQSEEFEGRIASTARRHRLRYFRCADKAGFRRRLGKAFLSA